MHAGKQFALSLILVLAGYEAAAGGDPPAGDAIALLDGRFAVRASWSLPGESGSAVPVRLTDDGAYFWFFSPTNPELFVKIVDACVAPYERFWVYAAGLTDVGVALEIVDLLGAAAPGTVWSRTHPFGSPFPPTFDTQAFATCDLAPACGRGAPADIAASPRATREAEELTLFLTDEPVARSADYERVVADLAAIRALRPDLAATFEPAFAPGDLLIGFDPAAAAAVRAGTFTGWSCLNDWYGFASVDELIPDHFLLRLDGRYRMDQVQADYAALPGVVSTFPNGVSYFPGLIPPLLCGDRAGEAFGYFFHEVDGRIWYFATTPGGAPALAGVAEPGETPPWRERAIACLADTPLDLPAASPPTE